MIFDRGSDILETFKQSDRIAVDLERWTSFSSGLGPMYITFRSFKDDLRAHMEFRCFVHKQKLNAISQYYDTCFFQQLRDRKQWYLEKMKIFYDEVLRHALPEDMENYILDLAVFDDGTVMMIELNPWATTSGAALFSWSQDRLILMNGPLEFRIVEEPMEGVIETFFPDLRLLIERVSQETEEERPKISKAVVSTQSTFFFFFFFFFFFYLRQFFYCSG
eukprot:TRINITY_DN4082_c0_g1_i13.p1 TRINITY_DN4082_c0_g1~~TRINITY_DN4082_c0_g1_i13.p1  ORF type:complete len:220 (-),score=31.85 TRINITY_DN4082_c0_g1_i13:1265-1924(-)